MPLLIWSVIMLPTFASELRPSEEVIAQENSPEMKVSNSKRCTSIFLASYFRLVGSGRNDVADLKVQDKQLSRKYFELALLVVSENHLPDTQKSLLGDVTKLTLMYRLRMDENERTTGNAVDSQIEKELRICRAILGP